MIIIKYPSVKDRNNEESNLRRQDINSDLFVRKITKMYKDKNPAINAIEIETINRCNNDCSFCPVNRNDESRAYHKMTDELFYSIINQLKEMNYSGYLSLFSNNEPLIDKRIYEFLEYAKENIPNATHALYTNGILLDEEKYLELTNYLDYLIIDNYNDEMELLPNVKEIVNKHKDDQCHCKVSVLMRKKTQILLNRGGIAPNRDSNIPFHSSCTLPFTQFIIRPDGKISRCCQDALAKTTLADLTKETVKEAWTNDEFKNFRNDLIDKGRDSIEFCQYCDSFGLGSYSPEYWTSKIINALVDIAWEKKTEGKKIFLYENNRVTRNVAKILDYHGLKVDGIVGEKDIEKINSIDSFTIFSGYDYPILNQIDAKLTEIGTKYIVYEDANASRHIDFLDEDENKEVKELIDFINITKNKKVIVFGTGFSAVKVTDAFKFDVAYYIDNNKAKEGSTFNDSKVWLPTKLSEEHKEDICVVVASLKYNEMKKQLVENELCMEENILEGLRYLD